MEKPYHIVSKENTEEFAKLRVKNGQTLLPMVELLARIRKRIFLNRGRSWWINQHHRRRRLWI